MSTLVEQSSRAGNVESTSASSTSSSRVSMFTAKSGFVIPKNKLSGSLVPIFQGGKKPVDTDAGTEEITKQVQRKTKWGPDLTQDASVRKARALAYQTRLDQITQQLKSGILEFEENQDSLLASQSAAHEPSGQGTSKERTELLELEKREVIGEIMKLNPSYKAPADYKPLLKEAKVPIPIKNYPGHNFISMIFGPSNDTHKRLEKETGAKIRIYGIKGGAKKEVEITSSNGNENPSDYEELYVLVGAESYDKVDAAVSLIELLLTPVTVSTSASSTISISVSGDNVNNLSVSQGTPAPFSPLLVNQGAPQQFLASGSAPQLGQFQPYQTQWVTPSSVVNPQYRNSSAPLLNNPAQVPSSFSNPSSMPSFFGPRPGLSAGFGSVLQNPSVASPRPQPALQFMPQSQTLRPPRGYTGPPRNPPLPPFHSVPGLPNFSATPFNSNPPTATGPNQNMRPLVSPIPQSVPPFTFPNRPLGSTALSQPPVSVMTTHMPQIVQPVAHPQGPQLTSQSPSSTPLLPVGPRSVVPNLTPNMVVGPQSTSMPQPTPLSGIAAPISISAPSFTPVKPPSVASLIPPKPSSNDFTFQPHRPQTPTSPAISQPGTQPLPQILPPQNLTIPPPQSPSFRPGMANPGPPSGMQGFSRAEVNIQMNQARGLVSAPSPTFRNPGFPGPSLGPGPAGPTAPVPQMGMGPRHFNPGNQGSNPDIFFPPRPGPGNVTYLQQNRPSMGTGFQNLRPPANQHQFRGNVPFPIGRPASSPSGAQQIYDPFSPTSVSGAPQLGGNPANTRKLESDPEYDDLMASVGVK